MDGVRNPLRPHTRRASAPGLALLLLAVVLAWCALTTDSAAGAGKPGKPVAKSPKGTVATVKPTFTWRKAARATSYEVRVYARGKLVLKRTGVKKSSWKSTKTLPKNTALTWKVRGKSRRGSGAWSRTATFRIVVAPPPSSAKAITAFSFEGLAPPVAGVIDESARAIGLTVPVGTAETSLVATFQTTGASVRVGGTTQASGVTANDFTHPVTYTAVAEDGSTRDYVVTVYRIGKAFGGGVTAYILQPGDPGYVAGETHGLIAAAADQSTDIQWYNGDFVATGATGTAIGTGAANTIAIVAAQGTPVIGYAAGLASSYTTDEHDDWYLPSKDELNKLYENRAAIGGFVNQNYYSSSEWDDPVHGAGQAWFQFFGTGEQSHTPKDNPNRVRVVRSF